MSDNKSKMKLPSLDDLFTTQQQRDNKDNDVVQKISIDKISDFPNHPFKVKKDEQMEVMLSSIRSKGILYPVIVRPKEDGTYEMISGHRRKFAASILGIKEIDAIVKDLTDDEATILMVDSNIQREEILPSEKAFSLKMKLDALNHQGKVVDLEDNSNEELNEDPTSTTMLSKLRSNEILAKEFGISRETVRKYIRLTYLIPELIEMVDERKLGFTQAVHLSYLDDEFQYLVLNKMEYDEISPSLSQSVKLKKMFQENRLTDEKLEEILSEEKPNQKLNQHIKYKDIRKYFPDGYSNEKIDSVIHKFLVEYYENWHGKERNNAR